MWDGTKKIFVNVALENRQAHQVGVCDLQWNRNDATISTGSLLVPCDCFKRISILLTGWLRDHFFGVFLRLQNAGFSRIWRHAQSLGLEVCYSLVEWSLLNHTSIHQFCSSIFRGEAIICLFHLQSLVSIRLFRNFKSPVAEAKELYNRYYGTDCAFSPDNRLILTGTHIKKEGDGKLKFFDR